MKRLPSTKARGVNPASKTKTSYRYRGRDYPTLGFLIQANAEVLETSSHVVELRDLAGAESAAHQPVQSAGGEDAYQGHFAKVAALGYSLTLNHPFVDGNKRTAYLAMLMSLRWSGLQLAWDELLTVTVMSLVATGHLSREGLRLALILGCGLDPTDPNID